MNAERYLKTKIRYILSYILWYFTAIDNEASIMNIEILLGVFILVAIDNLNGRFLLVNVGDSDVEEDHRMGDPAVDEAYDDPRLGEIARGKNFKIKEALIM